MSKPLPHVIEKNNSMSQILINVWGFPYRRNSEFAKDEHCQRRSTSRRQEGEQRASNKVS